MQYALRPVYKLFLSLHLNSLRQWKSNCFTADKCITHCSGQCQLHLTSEQCPSSLNHIHNKPFNPVSPCILCFAILMLILSTRSKLCFVVRAVHSLNSSLCKRLGDSDRGNSELVNGLGSSVVVLRLSCSRNLRLPSDIHSSTDGFLF